MSSEDKENYHRMAKEKDITEGKSKKDVKTSQRNITEDQSRDMSEWCQYRYKKLQNKGNDCWLNNLLQCLNHLTIRETIVKSPTKDISPLVSKLSFFQT